MKAGKKIQKKLATRRARWDAISSASGSDGYKIVNGTAYHRPGSQNLQKGN